MSTIVEKTLILASSSPRRQELIRSLNLPYRIVASDADETVEPGWKPPQIVEELSGRKARTVYECCKVDRTQGEQGVVIGSDTIVVLDDQVLGKPKDEADSKRMLQALQGRRHQVFSGVVCIDLATGETVSGHRMTEVHMKPLTERQIAAYIQTGEPKDKAGSYAIQGLGATIVERIEGDYFNVVGLPMSLLSDSLARLGVAVF
ncbi:Maf family protein [Paenibacillus filicis]|uniref:dTTP/UTP pyrophosphatase n=1 Tax=Paenibacillus gyeongsangnamensis TaxID=3388067 RepID=A0ABT4Q8Z4_9BACL|nr:Maf family protein [Paenibacillus filicis]MCZ8513345.1 Maf family protein [Paenibacillus filicis]